MKYILTLLIAFIILSANAQTLAIVNDPDGYVNVRKDGNNKAPIIGQLKSGTIIVLNEEDKSEWKAFDYLSEDEKKFDSLAVKSHIIFSPGYIHKSRITRLDGLPRMSYKKGVGFVSLKPVNGVVDTVVLSIKIRPFSRKTHTIQRSHDGFVVQIDKKRPWGIDGELPKKEIYDVALTINGNQVPMPKDSYDDLFEPGHDVDIYYDKMGNIYLHMLNSDGAGYYDLVWVINNNKLTKRYTDNSNA